MHRLRRVLAIIMASVAAVSCASSKEQLAGQHFQTLLLQGEGFAHVAYFKPGIGSNKTLHVYLEHDGIAWLNSTNVASDPTPRNRLMLATMALDAAPSLYLGRPCYFGRNTDSGCNPGIWTHQRYSETVVSSMTAALKTFLSHHDETRLIFFGYSGGGALAMLLAERFAQTDAVITIAGNLDIVAWAKRHDYSPLEGSLNPADRGALPSAIKQFHYVGGRDRNVPAALIESISVLPKNSVIKIPAFDHVCCWQAWWPNLLQSLQPHFVEN